MDILLALVERPGELVAKEEPMVQVWPNVFFDPADFVVHISALRRALQDRCNGNRFIINIFRRGYCFVAPAAPLSVNSKFMHLAEYAPKGPHIIDPEVRSFLAFHMFVERILAELQGLLPMRWRARSR